MISPIGMSLWVARNIELHASGMRNFRTKQSWCWFCGCDRPGLSRIAAVTMAQARSPFDVTLIALAEFRFAWRPCNQCDCRESIAWNTSLLIARIGLISPRTKLE